jgi:uncharacterized protein YifN (PemK superfamily)
MGIKFPIPSGLILLCNYDTGFRPPEMVKRRPALVVSPRLPHRDNLCAVVPLSLTIPDRTVMYQCELVLAAPLPSPWNATKLWAKADMIATVCFDRLDFFQTERDQTGRRKYLHPKVTPEQLKLVQSAILYGLGLGFLTSHL